MCNIMSINVAYEKAKAFEQNKDWYNAALTYDGIKDYMPALRKAAWCYSLAKNYKAAIEKYLQIIQIEPNNAQALYSLGYQYYAQKNWKEAIVWFEKALAINGNFFVVKYRLGYALIQLAGNMKQYTKPEFLRALGVFSECHQIWDSWSEEEREKECDTYFDVCFQHGKAIANMYTRYLEAEKYFRYALTIKPDDVICKYNLAKVLCNQQRYSEAKMILPNEKAFYIDELNAYIDYKLNNLVDAIKEYEEILKYRKKDYIYINLAEVLIANKQYKEAYKMCLTACQLNKNNHKNYYIMGITCFKLGLYKMAIEKLEHALSLKQVHFQTDFSDCQILLNRAREKASCEGYIEDEQLIEEISMQNEKTIQI